MADPFVDWGRAPDDDEGDEFADTVGLPREQPPVGDAESED